MHCWLNLCFCNRNHSERKFGLLEVTVWGLGREFTLVLTHWFLLSWISLSFLSWNIFNAFSPTDGVMRTQNYIRFFVWCLPASTGELWSIGGMLQQCMQAMTKPEVHVHDAGCTLHSDTKINKTKKVRKSKITNNNMHRLCHVRFNSGWIKKNCLKYICITKFILKIILKTPNIYLYYNI